MKNFSGKSWWCLPFFLAFASCTGGGLDGNAGGGPVGAPQGNFAQGTLGSLPDIQQMSDGCFSSYSLRFSGEAVQENKSWFPISEEQKTFPTPGLVLKTGKESLPNEEICSNCEGKIVRVIDFGNPNFNPFHFSSDMIQFSVSLRKKFIRPEILAQARYQDFPVSAVGDVSFKGLPIASGRLYALLLSTKATEPVSEPTAFESAEDLYSMVECSKKPEEHPYMLLRTIYASYNDPNISFVNVPPPEVSMPSSDAIKNPPKAVIHLDDGAGAEKIPSKDGED